MKPANYPSEPAHLWEHFYHFTQSPRPSKQEAAVRQYLVDLAEQAGHRHRQDTEGNLVIYVPASPGREDRPTVIIQNHLDMVTVKTADRDHDFHTDPLELQVNDGWLSADRTGSLMLNLDTEDWNELYIGCAGGAGWQFARSFSEEPLVQGLTCWQLTLRGLAGGHSGVQIHEQLGNAIKLLLECLREVPGLRLAGVDVGVAHNVIPREGVATFAAPVGAADALAEKLDDLRRQWLAYLPEADGGLELVLEPAALEHTLDEVDSLRVLDLAAAFPHGAQAYSLEQPADLVDLSINLAILRLQQGELFMEASYRFFNEEQSLPLQHSVVALARAFDLEVTPDPGYPGGQPDFHSPLLEQGCDLHQRLFGERPAVKAIHAGLECGILKSKMPGVDTLSFGPTIRGAHSPTERLRIDTVEPFWQFLTALLAEV